MQGDQPTTHTNKQTNRTLKAQTYLPLAHVDKPAHWTQRGTPDVEPEDYNGDCAYANGLPVLGCGTINGNMPFEWWGRSWLHLGGGERERYMSSFNPGGVVA